MKESLKGSTMSAPLNINQSLGGAEGMPLIKSGQQAPLPSSTSQVDKIFSSLVQQKPTEQCQTGGSSNSQQLFPSKSFCRHLGPDEDELNCTPHMFLKPESPPRPLESNQEWPTLPRIAEALCLQLHPVTYRPYAIVSPKTFAICRAVLARPITPSKGGLAH